MLMAIAAMLPETASVGCVWAGRNISWSDLGLGLINSASHVVRRSAMALENLENMSVVEWSMTSPDLFGMSSTFTAKRSRTSRMLIIICIICLSHVCAGGGGGAGGGGEW